MTHALLTTLTGLPARDRLLLKLFLAASLFVLALGIAFGLGTALARSGFITASPLTGYRLMSLHGVTIFFYWLYFAQAGLLLAFTAMHREGPPAIALRPLAWTGLAAMVVGLALSIAAAGLDLPLLYDAPPELAGEGSALTGAFYTGYLLLAAGLFCIACVAVATTLGSRSAAGSGELPAVAFACLAWAGLLMVSALAAVNAFFPAARWALGLGPMPADYSTAWHILFHNLHYLPLMATVLTWYVLVKVACGVESIFGSRFSKAVFALYLVFVPPTSLYHMFLEPGLAQPVRVAGSLLSLFISVPTMLVFLIIVASLEAHARARGARGLFGWLRLLPWRNPAMAAMGAAVINTAIGGSLSFVLIQEKLAPLLSDTFFVPGYFHFLTVGSVTLTFLAAFTYIVPALFGGPLPWRRLWVALPSVLTAGLLIFGAAGSAAGLLGAPRRALDITYGNEAPALWGALMAGIGIGGLLMTFALMAYVVALVRAMVPAAAGTRELPPAVAWGAAGGAAGRAWTGPLAVALLVAGMALFTVIAFELMHSLPLAAIGGGGH